MKLEAVVFATDESRLTRPRQRPLRRLHARSSASIPSAKLANPDDPLVLPEISRRTARPSVLKDESRGFQIVQDPIMPITAEELGRDPGPMSTRIGKSDNPAILRRLGVESSFGGGLGLPSWAIRIVKHSALWREFRSQRGAGLRRSDRARLNDLGTRAAAIRPPDPVMTQFWPQLACDKERSLCLVDVEEMTASRKPCREPPRRRRCRYSP